MRRLVAVGTLVLAAALASGCATGFVNKPPSDVTETSATVNGFVWTSDGGEVSYWVEYGTTTAYDRETTHRTANVAEDTPHDVSIPLTGLTPSTTVALPALCRGRPGRDLQQGRHRVHGRLGDGLRPRLLRAARLSPRRPVHSCIGRWAPTHAAARAARPRPARWRSSSDSSVGRAGSNTTPT